MNRHRLFSCLLLLFLLASCGREKEEFGEEYIPGFDDNQSARKGIDMDETTLYIKEWEHQIVYCADVETGDLYPLCAKPDCDHKNVKCNAQIPLNPGLCYYQDRLIASDGVKVRYLRLDGSGSEEIGKFADADYTGTMCESIVHRGYAYTGNTLFGNNEVAAKIMRLSIESGESEVVFELSWPYGETGIVQGFGIGNLCGNGSKVYFTANHKEGEEIRTEIYCFDTKNGKTSRIYEGAWQWATCLRNGKWYWQTETGVYCWNPETEEERCLYAFAEYPGWKEYMEIYQDGFIIREYDPVVLRFYDWEGNPVAQLDFPATEPMHFSVEGNFDSYLVCRYLKEDKKNYSYAVMDTGRLGEASPEWMFFEFEE